MLEAGASASKREKKMKYKPKTKTKMINNKTMNIMRKQLLTPKAMRKAVLYTCALFAFASCADNTYVGPETGENGTGGGAISFGYELPSVTRGEETGETAAGILHYTFQVYGTKTVSSTTSNVFATGPIHETSNTPYWAWFNSNTANTTNSNSAGWEYVGETGNKTLPNNGTFNLTTKQEIKYWDNNASQYDFVAFKANEVGTTDPAAAQITNVTTTGFTVSATPAQLAALYIADKKTIAKNDADFGKEVNFKFRNAATKVRLGIYETVPGYYVRNVQFHYNNGTTDVTSKKDGSNNAEAILNGSFIGASNSGATSFDVKYDANKIAYLEPTTGGTSPKTSYFNFGVFTSDASPYLGITSTSPTWAGGNANYTSVFPNTKDENIADMTLKISYELYNSGSGEVITVSNKTAIVPKAYMTWKPNYAYTYLFKITDDQLTPITLDAVVIDDQEGHQETITTIPNGDTDVSITTFGIKDGKYSYEKNEYETGYDIHASFADTKANANPVVLTPQLTEATKANYVKVYYVNYKSGATTQEKADHLITEASVADAIAKNQSGAVITTTEITSSAYDTYLGAAPTVENSDNTLKLTGVKLPTGINEGYYAVEIVTYPQVTSPTGNPSTSGYYELSTDTYSQSPDTSVDTNKTYYKQVKTYKVIKVVAAP